MGDLSRAGRSIRHCFVKENGQRFWGQLLKPPMSQTRTSSFFNPRRILKVDKFQNIKNGEIFQMAEGDWALTFDNTEGYYRDLIYLTYGIIILDHELTWKRRKVEADEVSKLNKTVGYEDLGKFKCALEFMRYEADSLKIPQPQYRLLCSADIRPGDLLDDQITVQHVEYVQGIVLAYVRGKIVGSAV